jgi:hypothetical protein
VDVAPTRQFLRDIDGVDGIEPVAVSTSNNSHALGAEVEGEGEAFSRSSGALLLLLCHLSRCLKLLSVWLGRVAIAVVIGALLKLLFAFINSLFAAH